MENIYRAIKRQNSKHNNDLKLSFSNASWLNEIIYLCFGSESKTQKALLTLEKELAQYGFDHLFIDNVFRFKLSKIIGRDFEKLLESLFSTEYIDFKRKIDFKKEDQEDQDDQPQLFIENTQLDFYTPFQPMNSPSTKLITLPKTCFFSGVGKVWYNSNIPWLNHTLRDRFSQVYPSIKNSQQVHYTRPEETISYGGFKVKHSLLPFIEPEIKKELGIDLRGITSINEFIDTDLYSVFSEFLTPTLLESSIALSEATVSNDFFKCVMGYVRSEYLDDLLPVTNVSWIEAIEFCNQLSTKCGYQEIYKIDRETNTVEWNRFVKGFRLPTTLEWECAARANTANVWTTGMDHNQAKHHICCRDYWSKLNKFIDISPQPIIPRGHLESSPFQPNAWGFYHMSGNVDEWCHDSPSTSFNQISIAEDTNHYNPIFSFGGFSEPVVSYGKNAMISSDFADSKWDSRLDAERYTKGGSCFSNIVDCAIGKHQILNAENLSPVRSFRIALQKQSVHPSDPLCIIPIEFKV